MTILELTNAIHGKLLQTDLGNHEYGSIKIDNRKIETDDVFVAIIGENHDGHSFISGAIENGACAIVCSKEIPMEDGIAYIRVEDTKQALLDLGHYYRMKYPIPLVAITGSVGKTTTKELTALILEKKYRVLKNEKNYNNEIGVPFTLMNLNETHEIAVIEMGMNHFGEIHRISKACAPSLGAITIIGTSHIGNLGSKENILKAKCEILDGMEKKELIINGDDSYLKEIKDAKLICCGLNDGNELQAINITTSLEETHFDIKYQDKIYPASIKLPSHVLTNVLIAIRIGLYYDVAMEDIILALASYESMDMRMNLIPIEDNNTIIDDCYNASFESMKGILTILKDDPRPKILVLGEIFELGDFSSDLHQKLKPFIEEVPNAKVILVGAGMRALVMEDALYLNSSEEVVSYFEEHPVTDTLILLKGSRKVALEKVKNYFLNNPS